MIGGMAKKPYQAQRTRHGVCLIGRIGKPVRRTSVLTRGGLFVCCGIIRPIKTLMLILILVLLIIILLVVLSTSSSLNSLRVELTSMEHEIEKLNKPIKGVSEDGYPYTIERK